MSKKTTLSLVGKIATAVFILILVLCVSSSFHIRYDLTEEKRYTLADATEQVLSNLEDTIRVTVYLDGEMPLSFINMRRDVSDLLQEFKEIAGDKFLIRFMDPQEIGDAKNFKHTLARLHDTYGLTPYTIQEEDETGKLTQRYIIPGIIVSTSKRYVSINMLSDVIGATPEEQINKAIQNLEYDCIKAIRQLTMDQRKNIAFLVGHGELPVKYSYSAMVSLLDLYNVDRVTTAQLRDSMQKYEAVVIAEPSAPFTEEDKYIIDQYIMRDGNVLFLGDMISVNMDSLKTSSFTYAMPKDLNISDLLFNLGVRVNTTVLLDNQCAKIPMNVSAYGETPRFAPVPWYYYPLLKPNTSHVITHTVDVVKSEFASTIDTLPGKLGVTKTVLLASSAYSRVLGTPNSIGFHVLQNTPDKEFFNTYYIPVGVLLEGSFQSLYKSRSRPLNISARDSSEHNRIIVVADGDIIKNEVEVVQNDTVPKSLSYYKYYSFDKRIYTGNVDFFVNAVNYLCGDVDLLQIRNREVVIRLLNKNRIVAEKNIWRFLNLALPVLIVIAVGSVMYFIRKMKYSRTYAS